MLNKENSASYWNLIVCAFINNNNNMEKMKVQFRLELCLEFWKFKTGI
jgi:hypothetical protein